jgi:hypothetical protein
MVVLRIWVIFLLKNCSELSQSLFLFRACSVSSRSIWIEWDLMILNTKQVKLFLNFFQSHPILMYWNNRIRSYMIFSLSPLKYIERNAPARDRSRGRQRAVRLFCSACHVRANSHATPGQMPRPGRPACFSFSALVVTTDWVPVSSNVWTSVPGIKCSRIIKLICQPKIKRRDESSPVGWVYILYSYLKVKRLMWPGLNFSRSNQTLPKWPVTRSGINHRVFSTDRRGSSSADRVQEAGARKFVTVRDVNTCVTQLQLLLVDRSGLLQFEWKPARNCLLIDKRSRQISAMDSELLISRQHWAPSENKYCYRI